MVRFCFEQLVDNTLIVQVSTHHGLAQNTRRSIKKNYR